MDGSFAGQSFLEEDKGGEWEAGVRTVLREGRLGIVPGASEMVHWAMVECWMPRGSEIKQCTGQVQ